MSQVWHRMRGLANPTPAVEPGGIEQNEWDPGGDITLPDDHFSRLHNPQNGRVPPQLPSAPSRPVWPQFPAQQYARYFTQTPAVLNSTLGFEAQCVRVDNYSSHWVFIQSAGIYVPPFIHGEVLLLNPAVVSAQFQLAAPPGHADASSLESLVVTIWYEAPQPAASGFSVPST